MNKEVYPAPPLHRKCRCIIEKLRVLLAGTATNNGLDGADWHLKHNGRLPDYYITKKEAEKIGYKSYLGNLSKVAPNKMIVKGVYENKNGHLPTAYNRVWYEADINYKSGYRGKERILFSNDGLIFVTYDHYVSFVEIE
ncbi:MAG: ribonuclease [Clostridia bacterium]|nr:ribonuclease [Clostridia bacterium]